jgi:hypothetical protein
VQALFDGSVNEIPESQKEFSLGSSLIVQVFLSFFASCSSYERVFPTYFIG